MSQDEIGVEERIWLTLYRSLGDLIAVAALTAPSNADVKRRLDLIRADLDEIERRMLSEHNDGG